MGIRAIGDGSHSEGIGASRDRGSEGTAGQAYRLGENSPEVGGGKTRDKVAEFAGTSARTLNKATAVVEAAEAAPEKFGHLILGRYGMP